MEGSLGLGRRFYRFFTTCSQLSVGPMLSVKSLLSLVLAVPQSIGWWDPA